MKRYQCKRTKGYKKPANTVYVGRPTIWGNPFVGPRAAQDYERWVTGKMRRAEFYKKRQTNSLTLHFDCRRVRDGLRDLKGKNLACWCKPDAPCHADVLLKLAARS